MDYDELSYIQKDLFDFAVSTNSRGVKLLNTLMQHGVEIKDKHIIDIGCGYGGLTIEARKWGAANSYGIDVDEEVIHLAEISLRDDENIDNVKFIQCDMLSESAFDSLPEHFFDMICVSDVFEHIHDTARLMYNISRLTTQNAVLFFAIPNGMHYFDYIETENHHTSDGNAWRSDDDMLHGISFLDPLKWHYIAKDSMIYYKRWEQFLSLFSYNGFTKIELLFDGSLMEGNHLKDILLHKFITLKNNLSALLSEADQKYFHEVECRLEMMNRELLYDMSRSNCDQLYWKCLVTVWTGIATKTDDAIDIPIMSDSSHRLTVHFNSNNIYNVKYALTIERGICKGETHGGIFSDCKIRTERPVR